MSNLTESELKDIMNDIYRGVRPSKERPMYWIQNGYSFKNDGDCLYVMIEKDVYIPITLEQYNSQFEKR